MVEGCIPRRQIEKAAREQAPGQSPRGGARRNQAAYSFDLNVKCFTPSGASAAAKSALPKIGDGRHRRRCGTRMGRTTRKTASRKRDADKKTCSIVLSQR